MRERVWLPFFTTREGGTGLGLANVRKIVQLHQGDITIATSDLGGAAFKLRFPLPEPALS
jgi:signal transduction histidine kinase